MGGDSLRNHMGFAIFDRVDRVNLETWPIHSIFTDLLVSIGFGVVRYKAEMNRPSRTGLDRFFEP